MTSAQIEIQLIASLVAIACAIPGVFLVLRKMALISDAISHAILPGIVVGFFITHDLSSPLLIILAAFTGILTVLLVELIQKTGLVKEDTAIGLIFPALFSIGVILIAQNANDVHLDIDAVLLGELAFAPFDRLELFGTDVGPKSLWVIGTILLITLSLLIAFFKELKLSTFDVGLASALGFSPGKGRDKVTRMHMVAPLFEASIVWAPRDKKFSDEVIEEVASFPYGDNDDFCDSMTLALMRFRQGGFISLEGEDDLNEERYSRKREYY